MVLDDLLARIRKPPAPHPNWAAWPSIAVGPALARSQCLPRYFPNGNKHDSPARSAWAAWGRSMPPAGREDPSTVAASARGSRRRRAASPAPFGAPGYGPVTSTRTSTAFSTLVG